MQRYASVELRQRVDGAVGSDYDGVFLRLDLLLTATAGRCRCADCRARFELRIAELSAALPPLD